MKDLSRSALLGSGSALVLIGLPLMMRFVAAAENGLDLADLDSLNAAIQLERAGIKAYTDGAGTRLLSAAVIAIANGFIADHAAHRDALVAAVTAGGGTPTAKTLALDYPVFHTQADVLAFALAVEQKAASTYLSVIGDLHNRDLSQVAASILGVETTHVSVISTALGKRVYPAHFVS